VEGSNKSLNGFAAYIVAFLVALGLEVDAVKTEGVLIDNSVDPSVAGASDPSTALLSTAIAHLQEQVHDCLFEKVRMTFSETLEQLLGNLCLNTLDAVFDLLNWVEYIAHLRFGIFNLIHGLG